jgi:hypothetical protein
MAWSRRALVFAAIGLPLTLLSLLYELKSGVLLPQVSGPRILANQIFTQLYRRTNPLPSPAKPFVRHIVAVGDLHGSIVDARQALLLSRVVDRNWNWTGNVDFFVQVGYIIDR